MLLVLVLMLVVVVLVLWVVGDVVAGVCVGDVELLPVTTNCVGFIPILYHPRQNMSYRPPPPPPPPKLVPSPRPRSSSLLPLCPEI